jgi:hypothetical protein
MGTSAYLSQELLVVLKQHNIYFLFQAKGTTVQGPSSLSGRIAQISASRGTWQQNGNDTAGHFLERGSNYRTRMMSYIGMGEICQG